MSNQDSASPFSSDNPPLRALQESADRNRDLYKATGPNSALLEKFTSPLMKGIQGVVIGAPTLRVIIEAPEFTCLCPLTGQPDFGTIKINYRPNVYCVESKSLKLYLMSFRQFGTFHEAVVNQIGDDLVRLLEPLELSVIGEFAPRGGISFHPVYVHPQS